MYSLDGTLKKDLLVMRFRYLFIVYFTGENVYSESKLDTSTCTGAYRLANDAQPSDDSNRIATIKFLTSVVHCHSKCHRTSKCMAFGWLQDTCSLYNSTHFEPSTNSSGYEIWIME